MLVESTFALLAGIGSIVGLFSAVYGVARAMDARAASKSLDKSVAESERAARYAAYARACEAFDKQALVLEIHNGQRSVTGTRLGYRVSSL